MQHCTLYIIVELCALCELACLPTITVTVCDMGWQIGLAGTKVHLNGFDRLCGTLDSSCQRRHCTRSCHTSPMQLGCCCRLATSTAWSSVQRGMRHCFSMRCCNHPATCCCKCACPMAYQASVTGCDEEHMFQGGRNWSGPRSEWGDTKCPQKQLSWYSTARGLVSSDSSCGKLGNLVIHITLNIKM